VVVVRSRYTRNSAGAPSIPDSRQTQHVVLILRSRAQRTKKYMTCRYTAGSAQHHHYRCLTSF